MATNARTEIEAEYTVVRGVIRSPGKFEGEPIYAPYFYASGCAGCATTDEDGTWTFTVGDEDRALFPELAEEGISEVEISENAQGFVYVTCR